jgi:hypothetical protein
MGIEEFACLVFQELLVVGIIKIHGRWPPAAWLPTRSVAAPVIAWA